MLKKLENPKRLIIATIILIVETNIKEFKAKCKIGNKNNKKTKDVPTWIIVLRWN